MTNNIVRKKFNGRLYFLLKDNVTKAEAVRSANWQRKGGTSARIEKVSRGHYRVWVPSYADRPRVRARR